MRTASCYHGDEMRRAAWRWNCRNLGCGAAVSGVPGECQDFADDAPHAPRPF